MSLSETASRIWTMCEEYVPLALEYLSLGGPYRNREDERTFDARTERIRIRFLFPGIAEQGFQLLLVLRELRWRYGSVQKSDQQQQSAASAHSAEQVEAMFEEKRNELEPLLEEFSSVQREILREKFLRIDAERR